MRLPLFILSFGAIFVGYLAKDLAIGLGTDFWGTALYVAPEHNIIIDSEFIPHYIKLTPVMFRITGATLSFLLYKDQRL
jgi:NADH-ubiquinone oxidoreductase chain 5